MHAGTVTSGSFPEWYAVERETAATIRKLTSVKELEYYISNQDEQIRRLAIIRLGELRLKESFKILSEVLDDRLETPWNKEAAAWAIKALNPGWDMEFPDKNEYTGKYNRTSNRFGLPGVCVKDPVSEAGLEFSSSVLMSLMPLNEDIRSSEGINFDAAGLLSDWLRMLPASAAGRLADFFRAFVPATLKFLGKSLAFAFVVFPSMIITYITKIITKIRRKSPARTEKALHMSWESSYRRYSAYREKTNLWSSAGNALLLLLRIILTPLRLLLRYRKAAIALVIILYLLLANTSFGRVLTHTHFGIDLLPIQKSLLESSGQLLGYAWTELKHITGLDETALFKESAGMIENKSSGMIEYVNKYSQAGDAGMEYRIEYVVTAERGLNLRSSPDVSSEKVEQTVLPRNSTVVFLGRWEEDSASRKWYYVRTPDGKTGWVYSKWLKENGGDRIDGR